MGNDLLMTRQAKLVRIGATLAFLILTLSGCGRSLATGALQGGVVDPPEPKPSFVLEDTAGQPFVFAEQTEGKLALLYFGYLNCPDICPVHLAQIAEVFDQDPALARETEVVFVSVDPERDSPGEIREFLDSFDSSFVGLSGTVEQLEAAQVAAGVPLARKIGEGDEYTVDHAGWVISYSPDGLNRAVYPAGTRQSEWLNDLPLLLGFDGDEPQSDG